MEINRQEYLPLLIGQNNYVFQKLFSGQILGSDAKVGSLSFS
jgi:hypothetical protein